MDNNLIQPTQTPTQNIPAEQSVPPVVSTSDQLVNSNPVISSGTGNKNKIFLLTGLVVLIVCVAGGVAWTMMQQTNKKIKNQAMVSKSNAQPTLTPVPSKTVVQDIDSVDTNENMSQDFTDVEKDVSSL